MSYNRKKPCTYYCSLRISHMHLFPMRMLRTRPLRAISHPLGRLDRKLLAIIHRLLESIMIALMRLPSGAVRIISARQAPSDALQLALQVGRAFLGFTPREIDALKVRVLLFEPGLRVLQLGLLDNQLTRPCTQKRQRTRRSAISCSSIPFSSAQLLVLIRSFSCNCRMYCAACARIMPFCFSFVGKTAAMAATPSFITARRLRSTSFYKKGQDPLYQAHHRTYMNILLQFGGFRRNSLLGCALSFSAAVHPHAT